MDIDYRGITVEITSITTVTPQQTIPSPRHYRKFNLQNCSIQVVTSNTAVPVQGSTLQTKDVYVLTESFVTTQRITRPNSYP